MGWKFHCLSMAAPYLETRLCVWLLVQRMSYASHINMVGYFALVHCTKSNIMHLEYAVLLCSNNHGQCNLMLKLQIYQLLCQQTDIISYFVERREILNHRKWMYKICNENTHERRRMCRQTNLMTGAGVRTVIFRWDFLLIVNDTSWILLIFQIFPKWLMGLNVVWPQSPTL